VPSENTSSDFQCHLRTPDNSTSNQCSAVAMPPPDGLQLRLS
jgi:hypothetical protein